MAAIGLVQIKYLKEDNERRKEIVAMYDKAFSQLKDVKIVAAPYPEECCYHIYEMIVPDREALLGELSKNEIYGGVHYRDNTEYSMYTYAQGTCPIAHDVSQHLITLPLHLWLSDDDINKIIRVVVGFYGQASK